MSRAKQREHAMKTIFHKFYALVAMALVACAVLVTPASAQSGYKIKSGDVLQIEVLEDPSLNREVLVLPSGEFSFPFAGTVSAGGRTVGQVQGAIANGIASNFAGPPNVFVSVRSLRPREPRSARGPSAPATMDIYLLGEVNSPGTKAVAPGTTFLQALAQSGGFSQFAAKKRIQLRRSNAATGEQTLIKINYRALANGAALKRDVVLQEGDVILVPERRLFE
jgi:polysaccharide export outer membrane protein